MKGASLIDIGAVSTRPGAREVDEKLEVERLLPILTVVSKYFPFSCLVGGYIPFKGGSHCH